MLPLGNLQDYTNLASLITIIEFIRMAKEQFLGMRPGQGFQEFEIFKNVMA